MGGFSSQSGRRDTVTLLCVEWWGCEQQRSPPSLMICHDCHNSRFTISMLGGEASLCRMERPPKPFFTAKGTTRVTEERIRVEEGVGGTLTHHPLLQKGALPIWWPKGKHGVWRTETKTWRHIWESPCSVLHNLFQMAKSTWCHYLSQIVPIARTLSHGWHSLSRCKLKKLPEIWPILET